MDFGAALSSFLITNATITAAVGTRSYEINLPQDCTYPALVFREMYTTFDHALQADSTLERPTYEIEAHGDTPAIARATINAVQSALQNYTGPMGALTCQAVLINGGSEDYDPDTGRYWASREFEFFVS